MKRLTKYEPIENSMFPYQLKDEELSTKLNSIHKLGQLEDIEELFAERLDIEDFSLIFVLKAITGTVYYKDRDNKIVKAQSVSFSFETGEFHLHRRSGTHFVDYEDYGIEWAFTKEELKDKE